MKKQPLVSIIIPTYNRAGYLPRAIESVLNQSYKNIEVIIIDDDSTDNTSAVLSSWTEKDPRIIVLRNKINLGLTKALNKGIRKARGKYIARLDDDDFWLDPKKLEKQVKFLEKYPDYVLVGGGMIKIDKEGKEIQKYLFPREDGEIRKSLLIYNLFVQSTVVFRKDTWEKVGGYDEKRDFVGEDRDLWLRLGKVGKFYNFQEFFTCYLNKKGDNIKTRKRNIRKLRAQITLRSKYRKDYPGMYKAILIYFGNYFYSFLPFSEKLEPLFFKLREIIFGPPPYFCMRKKIKKENSSFGRKR